MDDLKIGEYARLEDGNIIRLNEKNITDERLLKEIKIHSLNIKEIIEEGDYVNDCRVENIQESFINIATGCNYFQNPSVTEKDIKTIVTHELFEDMKFKV